MACLKLLSVLCVYDRAGLRFLMFRFVRTAFAADW